MRDNRTHRNLEVVTDSCGRRDRRSKPCPGPLLFGLVTNAQDQYKDIDICPPVELPIDLGSLDDTFRGDVFPPLLVSGSCPQYLREDGHHSCCRSSFGDARLHENRRRVYLSASPSAFFGSFDQGERGIDNDVSCKLIWTTRQ